MLLPVQPALNLLGGHQPNQTIQANGFTFMEQVFVHT